MPYIKLRKQADGTLRYTAIVRIRRSGKKVAPKYFGLGYDEARRRACAKLLPCRVFRLGGQKSPWLVSAADLAELIDRHRQKAG